MEGRITRSQNVEHCRHSVTSVRRMVRAIAGLYPARRHRGDGAQRGGRPFRTVRGRTPSIAWEVSSHGSRSGCCSPAMASRRSSVGSVAPVRKGPPASPARRWSSRPANARRPRSRPARALSRSRPHTPSRPPTPSRSRGVPVGHPGGGAVAVAPTRSSPRRRDRRRVRRDRRRARRRRGLGAAVGAGAGVEVGAADGGVAVGAGAAGVGVGGGGLICGSAAPPRRARAAPGRTLRPRASAGRCPRGG